jgi:hypothetical protein
MAESSVDDWSRFWSGRQRGSDPTGRRDVTTIISIAVAFVLLWQFRGVVANHEAFWGLRRRFESSRNYSLDAISDSEGFARAVALGFDARRRPMHEPTASTASTASRRRHRKGAFYAFLTPTSTRIRSRSRNTCSKNTSSCSHPAAASGRPARDGSGSPLPTRWSGWRSASTASRRASTRTDHVPPRVCRGKKRFPGCSG